MNKRILLLTDGKAGHENQSRAFARALGCDFDLVPVAFRSRAAKAASYILDRLGARCPGLLAMPEAPEAGDRRYSAVIGTGSGTFYAAKALARRLGVRCGVVLYPRGYRIGTFDCVLAPSFDRPKPAPNVIEIPANLVANDEEFYRRGVAAFRERHAPDGRRAVAVVVGGPNKCANMSADWMRTELEKVFADNPGCEFWVTTSRRTPPDVESVVDGFPFDYRLIYSRDHFNPIPAFVSLAQTLYVTAESTGMLSEACTSGTATVHAMDNLKPGPHKFRRFLEDLTRGGYVEGSRKIDLSEQFARARTLLGI